MDNYRFHIRKFTSLLMFTLCGLSVLIALVPLILIFYRTVAFGFSAINWDFFTQMPKPVGESGGGLANAIVGTLILVGLGCCLSLPIGIMAGIYLSEYGNNWFGQSVRFLTDVLNGIPSIVTGVVAYTRGCASYETFLGICRRCSIRHFNDSHYHSHDGRNAEDRSSFITGSRSGSWNSTMENISFKLFYVPQ